MIPSRTNLFESKKRSEKFKALKKKKATKLKFYILQYYPSKVKKKLRIFQAKKTEDSSLADLPHKKY